MAKYETTQIVENGLPRLIAEVDRHYKQGWEADPSRSPENTFVSHVVYMRRLVQEKALPEIVVPEDIPEVDTESIVQEPLSKPRGRPPVKTKG